LRSFLTALEILRVGEKALTCMQNHRKKMKNKYYPIVVTVPKSNKKNRKKQNRYL
jgi:hypothetical protein